MKTFTFGSVALTLFLSPSVRAQGPLGPGDLGAETRMSPILEEQESAHYARAMQGHVGDDADLDVVVRDVAPAAPRVLYLPNPAKYCVVCQVAPSPNSTPPNSLPVDAAVLHGAGPGGRDAILVLKAQGLEWWDAGPGEQAVTLRSTNTDADFQGAQRLWTAAGPGGAPCVFALDAAGTSVVRWQWSAGAGLTRLPALGTAMGAVNVLTMDYDNDGDVEVVMQLGDLVVVMDWETQVVQAWFVFPQPIGGQQAPAGTQNFIAVSRGHASQVASERDLLVAYGYYFQSVPALSEFKLFALNSVAANFISLGDTAPATAITTYDHDGDGYEEVVLACDKDSKARVVVRVAAASLFSSTAQFHYMLVGPAREGGAIDAICAGDFDGDGDGDLVGLQSAHCYLHTVFGNVGPSSRVVAVQVQEQEVAIEGGNLTLPLEPLYPPGWEALAAPGETIDVECVGWLRGSATSPIEQVASLYARQPAVEGEPVTLQGPVDGLEGGWSVELHVRLIVSGPGGERRLSPTSWFWSSEANQMNARTIVSNEWFHADANWWGGTGGAGNTEPGGDQRPPNEPPRP
ncbi:MAG TPA: FG-GAP-like repeat-containing protein [Planctomycetota bacterium]|nr:FG-GAP-like repeat-containing protein [Planctomycetota bacterium]